MFKIFAWSKCTMEAISKRERTRTMILEKALLLFQEQGFDKTTMRAIAESCGLSLGAAYYHFESKDALVLEFYQRGADEAQARNKEILAEEHDFQKRLHAILEHRVEQLSPYRSLVGVLARHGADMASPLSPFSPATQAMRDEAIALFEEAMQGSNLKVAKALRPHLPKLLWLMQLGLVLYWANDRSPRQQRTGCLIAQSLNILLPLLRATSLPFMGPIVDGLLQIITIAESCLISDSAQQGAVSNER
jgi:AcrR family transcriptional regulator